MLLRTHTGRLRRYLLESMTARLIRPASAEPRPHVICARGRGVSGSRSAVTSGSRLQAPPQITL